jgi:2-beta-glucuronyltransferase
LPAGVIHYDEIPFEETIGYIRHADFGIAPYRSDKAPTYLAETSLKLLQFAYFGVPAVCPHFAVGEATDCRFGYEIDDPATIKSSIQCALAVQRCPAGQAPSWDEHVQKLLKEIGFD